MGQTKPGGLNPVEIQCTYFNPVEMLKIQFMNLGKSGTNVEHLGKSSVNRGTMEEKTGKIGKSWKIH